MLAVPHTMRSLLRAARRMWPFPSAPRQFPTSNFEVIDSSRRIEEETLPWYNPLDFYPVKIGEVFQSRYQVTGKLGYGMNGTVWLCRDLVWREHVTLKIGTYQALQNEVEVSKHLRSIKTTHAGARLVRQLLDDFAVSRDGRTYHGIIQAPLSATLESLRMLLPDRALPLELLQAVLSRLLLALDFLHCEAQVIHTDIQAKNVLFGLDSSQSADDVCSAFEKRELECPSPRKYVEGRVIHTSRRLVPPIYQYAEPILSDFGEARFGKYNATVTIQPSPYRAPEVLLGIPFTPMVDVWNIGVMIPNLLGKGHLFKRTGGPDNEESDAYHLAHMVALLGSPPTEFLRRTKTGRSWDFFHEDGSWKGMETIPVITLEHLVADWDVGDKVAFLRFLRKMLQWEPENRGSPKQLLEDPWLNFVGAKA